MTSDLAGAQLQLRDPGRVHQGAGPPQRVDQALPLRRQPHVAAASGVEGRVDAVLEVPRRRDLQLLLPAPEHRHGNGAAAAAKRRPLEETTGAEMTRPP